MSELTVNNPDNKSEKNNKIQGKDNKKKLGRFLIARFIFVMIFIYLSSQLIELLVQGIALPFVLDKMYLSQLRLEGDLLVNVLKFLFAFVLWVMGRITSLPFLAYANSWISREFGVGLSTPAAIASQGWLGETTYYLGLMLLILIALLISLLPYALGGGWFIREVRAKISDLIEEDRREKEEYEKQRNLLLSDIAHDIKTPITTMSGYARAMSDGLVEEDRKKEYLDTIYAKSMRVSELIDMMFEYIKLDSAEYALNLQPYDLAEMTREVIVSVYQDFEEAGLELEIDIPEKECIIEMDKSQLSRCVMNLLTNALKYTSAGDKVLLRLDETDFGNGRRYRLTVADSGLVIDDEFAKKIFDPFTREDSVRSTKGGTGLGLSIAQKIVLLHGGEIELIRNSESEYTKEFVITL